MGEEFAGMAGIFGGNQPAVFKGFQRSQADIFKVADGGGDDIKHFNYLNPKLQAPNYNYQNFYVLFVISVI